LSDIFNTSTGLLLLPSDGMTNKAGKSQNWDWITIQMSSMTTRNASCSRS
jgi:hypothetical protein